ncbi:hypothetical protein ACTMTI_45945 [Nonomuraea sp. H19]|uniref:hypothetical protein n=1 Tax=Nonomuraea sp. H19 TaxID=3452206 RepID=UPI003F8BFC4F
MRTNPAMATHAITRPNTTAKTASATSSVRAASGHGRTSSTFSREQVRQQNTSRNGS